MGDSPAGRRRKPATAASIVRAADQSGPWVRRTKAGFDGSAGPGGLGHGFGDPKRVESVPPADNGLGLATDDGGEVLDLVGEGVGAIDVQRRGLERLVPRLRAGEDL